MKPPAPSSPYIVGLTGGIGSGKSAACERFSALGASVIDTDDIAHALTAPGGAAMEAIRADFGDAVISASGALDRAAMRERVFADAAARKRLEGILHPLIRAECTRLAAQSNAPYVVLAVPLLLESGHWKERCQRICVIDCPEELQIERVIARNQLDESQVRAIIAAQTSREARRAAADDIVDNSSSLAELHRQIDALHTRYISYSCIRSSPK